MDLGFLEWITDYLKALAEGREGTVDRATDEQGLSYSKPVYNDSNPLLARLPASGTNITLDPPVPGGERMYPSAQYTSNHPEWSKGQFMDIPVYMDENGRRHQGMTMDQMPEAKPRYPVIEKSM